MERTWSVAISVPRDKFLFRDNTKSGWEVISYAEGVVKGSMDRIEELEEKVFLDADLESFHDEEESNTKEEVF